MSSWDNPLDSVYIEEMIGINIDSISIPYISFLVKPEVAPPEVQPQDGEECPGGTWGVKA